MEKRMSATDARRHLGALLADVADGDTVIVERSRQAVAAVVPIGTYERWMERRDAQFAAFDRIRANVPVYPEHEVEADVAEAIAEVRAARRKRARNETV